MNIETNQTNNKLSKNKKNEDLIEDDEHFQNYQNPFCGFIIKTKFIYWDTVTTQIKIMCLTSTCCITFIFCLLVFSFIYKP